MWVEERLGNSDGFWRMCNRQLKQLGLKVEAHVKVWEQDVEAKSKDKQHECYLCPER